MRRILTSGWLKQKGNRCKKMKYIVSCLDISNLPEVMALQNIICRHLGHPDLLESFSCDFMEQHMGDQGMVLGVFADHKLIAFRNVYYPKPWDREWNLGRDLNLSGHELTRVVNFQMVCVHPSFRGNSLSLKMNRIALALLRQKGTHPHVCATVSPQNVWNIPVLLNCGFAIAKLKPKYGGKMRYIVYQNLHKPLVFNNQYSVRVNIEDPITQKQLLESGYYGVAINKQQITTQDKPTIGNALTFKLPEKEKRPPLNSVMPPMWTMPQEEMHITAHSLRFLNHRPV